MSRFRIEETHDGWRVTVPDRLRGERNIMRDSFIGALWTTFKYRKVR